MNKLLIALPLSLLLMACPAPIEPPSSASVALAVNRAVSLENTSALRCPKSNVEKFGLRQLRSEFDNRYRGHMDSEQIDRLDAARKATDEKCGL